MYAIRSYYDYYKDNHRLQKAKKDPQQLDSILVNVCLNELAKNLKENNTFANIHIFPELFKPHQASKLPALNYNVIDQVSYNFV